MADEGDVKTLSLGSGLILNNEVLYLTLDDDTRKYLGIDIKLLANGKQKIVRKFDKALHKGYRFVGIGVRED